MAAIGDPRQIVQIGVPPRSHGEQGVVLTYVWKGAEPLVVGDRVRVRNPREPSALIEGIVVELSSDYDGYLVIINSKVD